MYREEFQLKLETDVVGYAFSDFFSNIVVIAVAIDNGLPPPPIIMIEQNT